MKKMFGRLFLFGLVMAFISCMTATSMTSSEVNNTLPTLTKSRFISKAQVETDIQGNEYIVLTKGRKFSAPMGITVGEDLVNAARGIDEWVENDGGNAYVLVNFEWAAVYNGTQLSVEFDTMLYGEAAAKRKAEENAPVTEDLFDVEQNKEGEITIKDFKGQQTSIVIPDKISGIEVSDIGELAFGIKGYSRLNGKGYGNVDGKLSNYSIPSTGDIVITWKLKGLTLPKYLIRIGRNAFLGDTRFGGGDLTEILIPENVTSIGNFAFAHNKIEELILPNGLKEIGEYAFLDNNLTEVAIPDSVTSIGRFAFANNKLTEIVVPNSIEFIPHQMFEGNPLKKISLPLRLKEVRVSAFNDLNGITEISLGDSVDLLDGNNNKITDGPFINYYISQGRKAGTYVLNGQIWSRKN